MDLTLKEIETLKICLVNNMILEKKNNREKEEYYVLIKKLLKKLSNYEKERNKNETRYIL